MSKLMRILRKGRHLEDKKHILFIILIVPMLVTVGTCVYSFFEGWSWMDAFYFSVITLTTIGYGDLAPSNDISKLFTVFYVLSGVTLFGYFIRKITLYTIDPLATPVLGAQLIKNNKTVSSCFKLPTDRGVVVTSLCTNGIAHASGIRLRDVLLAIDNYEISSEDEVIRRISKKIFGPEPRLTVARNNDIKELKIKLSN